MLEMQGKQDAKALKEGQCCWADRAFNTSIRIISEP